MASFASGSRRPWWMAAWLPSCKLTAALATSAASPWFGPNSHSASCSGSFGNTAITWPRSAGSRSCRSCSAGSSGVRGRSTRNFRLRTRCASASSAGGNVGTSASTWCWKSNDGRRDGRLASAAACSTVIKANSARSTAAMSKGISDSSAMLGATGTAARKRRPAAPGASGPSWAEGGAPDARPASARERRARRPSAPSCGYAGVPRPALASATSAGSAPGDARLFSIDAGTSKPPPSVSS